jgi:proline iminopeptidase
VKHLSVIVVAALSVGAVHAVQSAQRTVTVADGITVSVREAGTGSPVIALHGGPGFRDYLPPDLEPLTSSFRVISYDQRGSGHSTVVTDPTLLTAPAFVADLDRVRESLGIARVTLLGHSWGAGLAALYAIAHPDRIERLLLVGPMPPRADPYMTAFSQALQSRFTEADRAAMAEASARRQKAADADAADACRAYYAVFIRGYFHNPAAAARMRGDVCAAPAPALRNFSNINRSIMGSLGAFDLRPELAAIKVPALVIHGASDPIPMASAREWAASLPDGRLLVIEQSGHFPFVERPDAFFPAATAFLKGEWPPEARRIEKSGAAFPLPGGSGDEQNLRHPLPVSATKFQP